MNARTILSRLLLFAVLLLVGCVSPKNRARIDRAATMIDSMPVECLATLDSIRFRWHFGRLFYRDYRARYALLYTAAQDKNYIDVASDSLLRIAVDYYSRGHGTPLERMQTNYYLARIRYNAGDKLRAMNCMLTAEREADAAAQENPYAVGLLYSFKGVLSTENFDHHSALRAFELSYDYFELAANEHEMAWAKIFVANSLFNLQRYEESEQLYLEVLHNADYSKDSTLYQHCVADLMTSYYDLEQYEKLQAFVKTYNAVLNKQLPSIRMIFAYLHAVAGDQTAADDLLYQAKAQASSATDIARVHFTRSRIHQALGDHKAAFEEYKIVTHIQDTVLRRALQQPLMAAQRDYYRTEAELQAARSKHTRMRLGLLAFSLFFAIVAVIHFARRKIAAKREQIELYIELVEDLKIKSQEQNNQLQDLMNQQIAQLFRDRFHLLNQLSTIYYETHSLKKDKDAIYDKVRKEIAYWSDQGKHFDELEQIVNRYKSNVMACIRRELPNLSKLDYRFLCLIYAGFSTKTISILTGEIPETIRSRKSRLKTKLQQLNPPSLHFILTEMP